MTKKPSPNIILINCDDLGYGDIGCYGSLLNDTPAIDRLAKEGVRFTDFYAPAPVCTPSRAGLMTGSYPKRMDFMEFGVYDHREPERKKDSFVVLMPGQPEGLHPNERTIANVLKDAGYSTKMIGKWHLGDQEEYSPLRFGFDSWLGLPYSNDMGLQHPPPGALSKMSYTLHPLPLMQDYEVIQQQPDQQSLTELYTREAVKFIRDHQDSPFFLYLAHMYVHHPLYVPQQFVNKSRNGDFGAAVAMLDWSVSVLMHELQRLGIDEDTMVIFTSDNGGDHRSSNAPLRGYKGSTWEGGQRVPCIVRWPRVASSGRECTQIASAMDFFATFEEITGTESADGLVRDGRSLMQLLQDDASGSTYNAFCYFSSNELQAIRVGQYKLHLATGALYDLSTNIAESRDLAFETPEIVAHLEAVAEQYRNDLGDSLTGVTGARCRPKGFVADFRPLAIIDANHPYIVSAYDADQIL